MNKRTRITLPKAWDHRRRNNISISSIGLNSAVINQLIAGDPRMESDVCSLLNSLAPPFGMVVESNDFIFAAADTFRTFPFFFRQFDDCFWLGTEVEEIKQQDTSTVPNFPAIRTFLLCGHTPGNDTLSTSIQSLSVGQYLIFSKRVNSITKIRYTNDAFPPNEFLCIGADPQKRAKNNFDAVERIAETSQSRPILVPFRGRAEDLLLLTLLSKYHRQGVSVLSFLHPGNPASRSAKRLCEESGVYFYTISSTRTAAVTSYWSKERERYFRFFSNLVSLPNSTEYRIFSTFISKSLLPTDTLVVDPIPSTSIFENIEKCFREFDLQADKSSMAFLSAFFDIQPSNTCDYLRLISPDFIDEISPVEGSTLDISSLAHRWSFCETLPKTLVNSRRLYEYFNIECAQPAIDSKFLGSHNILNDTDSESNAYHATLKSHLGHLYAPLCKSLLSVRNNPATLPIPTFGPRKGLEAIADRLSYFFPWNRDLAAFGYKYFLLNYQTLPDDRMARFSARHFLSELGILAHPQEDLPSIRSR